MIYTLLLALKLFLQFYFFFLILNLSHGSSWVNPDQWRVPSPAWSPACYRYIPTSFRFAHLVVLCWLVEFAMIWVQPSNERNFPYLVAADISGHQWTCAAIDCEGFVRFPPVFRSLALPRLVGQKWRSLVGSVARNVISDFWFCNWLKLLEPLAAQNIIARPFLSRNSFFFNSNIFLAHN